MKSCAVTILDSPQSSKAPCKLGESQLRYQDVGRIYPQPEQAERLNCCAKTNGDPAN